MVIPVHLELPCLVAAVVVVRLDHTDFIKHLRWGALSLIPLALPGLLVLLDLALVAAMAAVEETVPLAAML